MANEKKANAPVQKFRSGPIQLAVWENPGQERDGKATTFLTHSFSRSYQKDGEWKETQTLRTNDLPRLQRLLSKAFDYATMEYGKAED